MSEVTLERAEIDVLDGTKMGVFLARPRGEGRHPGLLVFQEAFGVNAHIRDVVQRFAREGFCAAAPELFHRTAPPGFESKYDFEAVRPHYAAVKNETLDLDIKAADAWLRGLPFVRGDSVSCIGFCLGGRAAFFANTLVDMKAAVSFYGGGIAPSLLPRADKSHGPILMCWGGRDKNIPPEQIALVTQALRSAGRPFVNAEFAASDHGFFCDARASYDPAAARQAWALALSFLKS